MANRKISTGAIASGFLDLISQRSAHTIIIAAYLILLAVGLVDYWAGYEYSFSLFYILPILIVTWSTTPKSGMLIAFFAVNVWLTSEFFSGKNYSYFFAPLWNTSIRMILFCIVIILTNRIKTLLDNEKRMARIDALTSAINSRYFQEILEIAVARFHRYGYPLAIAYLDVDNFKAINDNLGHAEGDLALQIIVSTMQKCLRRTDVVARLGGDEFAILIPDTALGDAEALVGMMQDRLLGIMEQHHWPITFSIGLVGCTRSSISADSLIKKADNLMYEGKFSGKNRIICGQYDFMD